MPVNGYTVGKDIYVDIIRTDGRPLRLKVKTGFSCRQEVREEQVTRMDGVVDPLKIPAGWTGTLELERGGPEADDFFAEMEADFYAGRNIQNVSITETITEPDGRLSQFRFINVAMSLSDGGTKGGGGNSVTVKQKIDWRASRRLKIR